MVQATCIQKNRDAKGNILNYVLQDSNGAIKSATSQQIKDAIKAKSISINNLQIDKAGRLIDKKVDLYKNTNGRYTILKIAKCKGEHDRWLEKDNKDNIERWVDAYDSINPSNCHGYTNIYIKFDNPITKNKNIEGTNYTPIIDKNIEVIDYTPIMDKIRPLRTEIENLIIEGAKETKCMQLNYKGNNIEDIVKFTVDKNKKEQLKALYQQYEALRADILEVYDSYSIYDIFNNILYRFIKNGYKYFNITTSERNDRDEIEYIFNEYHLYKSEEEKAKAYKAAKKRVKYLEDNFDELYVDCRFKKE